MPRKPQTPIKMAMRKPAIIRFPTPQAVTKVYAPYALELGKLIYAWNHLHESLAHLFWQLTGIKNGSIALAIWHSVQSDRTQRGLLHAAATQALADNKEKREDVLWLLAQVDNKLAGNRNDAIHAPLIFTRGGDDGDDFRAHPLSSSPRAAALRGKNLLNEFVWYRERAETLRQYCTSMRQALLMPERSQWPKRPMLPALRK